MSKERDAIRREIVALEAKLDGTKRPARQARQKTSGNQILDALGQLESMVKNANGESFMDDMVEEEDIVSLDPVMDGLDDLDDLDDESSCGSYVDDDDVMMATRPPIGPIDDGAEDDISQDYLDDVLAEEKDPASIVTDPSMLDAAPTGYVARLKSASARLDRVAAYCEQQGQNKLAFRIDTIADAIDGRVKKMEARDA